MRSTDDGRDTKAELFKAIGSGDADAVRELLATDPRLATALNPEGLSALTWAAYRREPAICDLLLAAGVKPDVFEASALGLVGRLEDLLAPDRSLVGRYSPDGWTPLHLAAHFGRLEAMRVLISRGASHRAVSKNSNANQPLQAAAAGGQTAAVELLLRAGAEVDARSHGGTTALHLAAQNGIPEMVRALLDAGADPRATTEGGKTASDFAISADRAEVVQILEAALSRWPRSGKGKVRPAQRTT